MQGKKHYSKKKKIKQSKVKYLVLLVVITFIMLGGILITKSRYALKYNTLKTINSDSFYFNSYSLGEEEKQYNINENIVEFKVINYEDELRFSNVNVEYEVKAEIVSTSNNNITVKTYINNSENTEGTLTKNQKSEDTVKIEVDGASAEDNIELRVTVIAKSPYSKKLSAIYNIKPETSSKEYDVNLSKENDYVNLLIRTYSCSGTLKVNFEKTKLMPYAEKQESVTIEGDYVTINVNKNSNYSLKFIASGTIKLDEDITIEKY